MRALLIIRGKIGSCKLGGCVAKVIKQDWHLLKDLKKNILAYPNRAPEIVRLLSERQKGESRNC
jgi:hypothetical protein